MSDQVPQLHRGIGGTEGVAAIPRDRPAREGGGAERGVGSRLARVFRLRDWGVRSRLVALVLVLVPAAAAAVLGGAQVTGSVRAASAYAEARDLAGLAERVSALTHELAAERDRTAWHIALGRPQDRLADVQAQMARTDTEAARVRDTGNAVAAGLTGRARGEVERLLSGLAGLGALRQRALSGGLLDDAAFSQYSLVIRDLASVYDEVGRAAGDDEMVRRAAVLTALARIKEHLSAQRGQVAVVLVAGRFEQEQFKRFLGEMAGEESERRAYAAEATAEERRALDEIIAGPVADRALLLRETVLTRAGAGQELKGLDTAESDDAALWYEAMTAVVDRAREIERGQTAALAARAAALYDAERERALRAAGLAGLLLLAVLLITALVARSLARPLRRLRAEALVVAGHRLPGVVRRMREAGEGHEPVPAEDAPPIGVRSRDEIGDVARAFDEVHREAVRLAGDEARLRADVNAMFVNLSRRGQTLAERQLTLVERLERGERDDKRLADLSALDHLAVRMRRTSENLLILAGREAVRRRTRPVSLMDVVRAAVSQVEDEGRVQGRVHEEVAIAGQAGGDIVHLLAELVENALAFSPRDTKVVVMADRVDGGGIMLSVADRGIGMSQEEIEQANDRLARPPAVDVSASRRMGLFVVGRLAARHGVRVRLRRQETGGMIAMALIPPSLILPAQAAGRPVHRPGPPNVHRPVPPEAQRPVPPEAHRPVPPEAHRPVPPEAHRPVPPEAHRPVPPEAHRPVPPEAHRPVPPEAHRPVPPEAHRPVPPEAHRPVPPEAHRPVPPEAHRPVPPGAHRPVPPEAQRPVPLEAHRPVPPGQAAPRPASPAGAPPWPVRSAPAGPPPAQPAVLPAAYGGPLPRRAPAPFDPLRSDGTGPLPRVGEPPQDPQDDFLPIYAEVRSLWFRADPGRAGREEREAPAEWTSPADAGWRAAEKVNDPSFGGVTPVGLPRRKPKANLVPGSVALPAQAGTPAPAPPPPASSPLRYPPRSPERMRSRFAALQEGVRRGRAEIARGTAGPRPGPDQDGPGQEGPGQDGPDQNRPDQNRPGQDTLDQDREDR